ncbi:MAG: hypothetical protein ACRCX2_04550 [Paraclostridium sp.]
MKLLPVKVRPECDSYHCCYYMILSDTEYYVWRIHVDHVFSEGYVESPKNSEEYDIWVNYL